MQAFVFFGIRNKPRNKNAITRVIITSRDMVMSWIDNVFSFLDQGRVGIFVGVMVTVVMYFVTRKRNSVAYVHLGEHLLGSASASLPSGIVVQYEGISVPRLTKSIIIIWNNGDNTVSGSDIVSKDPLRFHVGEDGRILSLSVLKASRAVNEFRILAVPGEETSEAVFTFDFLDAKDGAVVEILHTSTNRIPSAKGTLRGLPQGLRNMGQFTRPKPPKKKKTGPLATIAAVVFSPFSLACAGFAFAIYGPHPIFFTEATSNDSLRNVVMGGLGGFFAMWVISSWSTRRKYPKGLHLESLE